MGGRDGAMAKLKQSLQQKLQQKLSPQQIQVIRLLEIPTLQLEERVKRELEENPTLEEGPPTEEAEAQSRQEEQEPEEGQETDSADDEFSMEDYLDLDDDYAIYNQHGAVDADDDPTLRTEQRYAETATFRESLLEQIRFRRADKETLALAEYIVGNLDTDGYLRRDLRALSDDILLLHGVEIPLEKFEEALRLVQTLEPRGVGATSLQECLLLQLEGATEPQQLLAKRILEECYGEFTRKHYDKITEKLGISDGELKAAIDEIVKLNPKPGDLGGEGQVAMNSTIVPDFLLSVDEQTGALSVTLNGRNTPDLRINRSYSDMLKNYAAKRTKATSDEKEAAQFVRKKIDSARWFIESIRQRNETLLAVMVAIAKYQEAYFHSGDETQLRPMILKDIAEMTALDISTVSRVVNSKYVQTPMGIRLLRDFFSEGLQNAEGEEVSTREVKTILQQIVDGEDKLNPLTDDQLREALAEKGYVVARRTIAKYRDQLRIPVARLRKEL